MDKPEALKILDEAKRLIIEKGWTQGYYARNAAGERAAFMCDEATSFCVLGAAYRAAGEGPADYIRDALVAVAPAGEPAVYNDAEGRTKEEILTLLDKAKEWING